MVQQAAAKPHSAIPISKKIFECEMAGIAEEEGDIALEELAREFVRTEQEHHDEVNKMLRSPK